MRPERAAAFPFILCITAICAATLFFVATVEQRRPADAVDIWFVSLAMTLPPAALTGLAIHVHRLRPPELPAEVGDA